LVKIVRIIMASFFSVVAIAGFLWGSVIPEESTGDVSVFAYPAPLFEQEGRGYDIREDISRAQEILTGQRAGYTTSVERFVTRVTNRRGRVKEKVVVRKTLEPAFLLAVENLHDRRIRVVRFAKNGCETDGFDVAMIRKNGVGSRFLIKSPENMALLALKTTVHAGKKGYEEVVYTPYSPEIDTPEIREDGLNYLKKQIEQAEADLGEKNVPLRGFDALSGDFTATEVSLVLSIIEHIDPSRFLHAPPGGEAALVNEVLTIIGANTTKAYAYSRSTAGARGLFQFIPGTYEKISRKYPKAQLHKDFVAGCSNHVNAAKASILLFDSDLTDLPSDYLNVLGRDVRAVGRYLAAAYNCGSKRVERSLRGCVDRWTCLLPAETKIYLQKFDAVWNLGNGHVERR
jgi:hypothetical protein